MLFISLLLGHLSIETGKDGLGLSGVRGETLSVCAHPCSCPLVTWLLFPWAAQGRPVISEL